jgi:hypothetical protein
MLDIESASYAADVNFSSMQKHIKLRCTRETEKTLKKTVDLVREQTIPTEWLPLVGDVSANFCERKGSHGRILGSLDRIQVKLNSSMWDVMLPPPFMHRCLAPLILACTRRYTQFSAAVYQNSPISALSCQKYYILYIYIYMCVCGGGERYRCAIPLPH